MLSHGTLDLLTALNRSIQGWRDLFEAAYASIDVLFSKVVEIVFEEQAYDL